MDTMPRIKLGVLDTRNGRRAVYCADCGAQIGSLCRGGDYDPVSFNGRPAKLLLPWHSGDLGSHVDMAHVCPCDDDD